VRHWLVALDEYGRTICEVDLSPAGRGPVYCTEDFGLALRKSGQETSFLENQEVWMHPRNRRNVARVRVAGYEIVSEAT